MQKFNLRPDNGLYEVLVSKTMDFLETFTPTQLASTFWGFARVSVSHNFGFFLKGRHACLCEEGTLTALSGIVSFFPLYHIGLSYADLECVPRWIHVLFFS